MTEFEKLGGTYRQAGEYYLPNLEIDNQIEVQIGVWGQRHRRFLKENHRVRYYNLLTTGTLNDYLAEVESLAQAMFGTLVKELSEKENFELEQVSVSFDVRFLTSTQIKSPSMPYAL